ncbi:MAG: hypothetical protein IPL28_19130 [Chloroflexi bacterium]|nr:hypothetical protein [Chloroflexota bacterium]
MTAKHYILCRQIIIQARMRPSMASIWATNGRFIQGELCLVRFTPPFQALGPIGQADGIIYMAAGNAGLIVLQRVPIPAE